MIFYETSAKNSVNVDVGFNQLAREAIRIQDKKNGYTSGRKVDPLASDNSKQRIERGLGVKKHQEQMGTLKSQNNMMMLSEDNAQKKKNKCC